MTLAKSVNLVTNGGYISGPGNLTLTSTGNLLQNTSIDEGATVAVASGGVLGIGLSGTFPGDPIYMTRITGATLTATGTAKINIEDANLYIGTNGLLKLTAIGNTRPRVTFSGAADIFQVAAATNAKILVEGGQFFNTNPDYTPVIEPDTRVTNPQTVYPGVNNVQWLNRTDVGGTLSGIPHFQDGVLVTANTEEIQPTATAVATGSDYYATSVINEGTLTPGVAAMPGTLSFTGNYSQTSTGTLSVYLDNASDSDQLEVGGTVNLAGMLSVDVGSGFAPSSPVTLINDTGLNPISGTFAGLSEGAVISVAGSNYDIDYDGGANDNEVLLEPDTTTPITLTSSVNPSFQTQSVTYTATVTSSGGTPTGSVEFYDNGSPLGSSPLSGGVATYTESGLSSGSHVITAVYTDTEDNTWSVNLLQSVTAGPAQGLRIKGSPTYH